jgi:hypothetical protein
LLQDGQGGQWITELTIYKGRNEDGRVWLETLRAPLTEDCIAVATADDGRSDLDAGVGSAGCGVEVRGRSTGTE